MRWLRTDGAAIADEDGKRVALRGVGVGGWLNMENFITGYAGTEHDHRQALRRALGERRYTLFFASLMDAFFGPEDAAFIASLGMNTVRIPVNYRLWEDDDRPGEIREGGFRYLDAAVDACAAAGLYTVIDLHAVPGGQNHHWHSDNPFHRPMFWQYREFQDRTVALWRAIAGRYRDRPEVAGYNVLNEPADEEGDRLVAFYRHAEAAIRDVDERHMLFLDGNRYSREFPGFGEPFANTVYAIHQYPDAGAATGGPYPGADLDRDGVAAEFRAMTAYTRERGLPVWVGEFGPVYSGDPARDAMRRRLLADQIAIYEEAGAGWSLWTYKDIGVQGLVTVDPESAWMRRTAAFRARKAAVGADNWGMTGDGIRDVMDPALARFEREFPAFEPYPFGTRRHVEQLVRNILFAEPLVAEFAARIAEADDEELVALGRCFAFGACRPDKPLCAVVAVP